MYTNVCDDGNEFNFNLPPIAFCSSTVRLVYSNIAEMVIDFFVICICAVYNTFLVIKAVELCVQQRRCAARWQYFPKQIGSLLLIELCFSGCGNKKINKN